MLTLDGERRFPSLTKLMMGLLSIPASNADSERGFSILRKINQSTIIALMSIKFNCEYCCIDSELNSDLLKSCKKATVSALLGLFLRNIRHAF